MTAKQIIETLTIAMIAKATGMPPNTVSHWKARGIPPKHWIPISRAAFANDDTKRITFEVIAATAGTPGHAAE